MSYTLTIRFKLLATMLFVCSPFQIYAEHSIASSGSVFQLPLEDLMQQQVTSITKKLQKVEYTAASAYIITAKDITRSGATSLPEVLRLAPGVNVAAINSNRWAVSIRGFNSRLADKLLVLLDGRTIYPPLFPGTLWENNDIPLELIERVEVLRGPGAAAWGNNAMNGVINIITKSSHDTVGGNLSAIVGSEQRASGNGSYGWAIDEKTSFRVNVHGKKTDESERVSGGGAKDHWESQSIGFRLDKELQHGRLLLQGGAFNSHIEDQVLAPRFDGGVDLLTGDKKSDSFHLQSMWEYHSASGTLHTLQGFTEYAHSDFGIADDRRKTVDLEYQQQIKLAGRHDLIWGVGYRLWNDGGDSTPYVQLKSNRETSYLASVFFQDDISLISDKLVFSVGARLESRGDVDSEFQPNIRLLWAPNEVDSAWVAISRTARMLARTEREASLVLLSPSIETFGLPVVSTSNLELKSETLKALDFGWRHKWHSSFSTDLAGFIYSYNDLRSTQVSTPTSFPPTSIPLIVDNHLNASSYGAELNAVWRPNADWHFILNYSWFQTESSSDNPAVLPATFLNSTPTNTASLQLSHQINQKLEWSGFVRFVDKIDVVSPTLGLDGAYHVPSYTTLDMKLKYQLAPDVTMSIIGQNLLESSHKEFIDDISISPAVEIQRGIYFKVDWIFK